MQKVIRRTILAEKQAARRLAKRTRKNELDEFRFSQDRVKQVGQEHLRRMKENRTTRREDWELGDLASKRDVGSKAETYGSISAEFIEPPALRKVDAEKIMEKWGGSKLLNIREGDRVVILAGNDKGKIGKVEKIDKERAEVVCVGLNMIDVAIPEWMVGEEESEELGSVRSIPQGISLNNVRLVFPYRDPKTGLTRDVIAKNVVHHGIWHNRHATPALRWRRAIPGEGTRKPIVIPWPIHAPKEFHEYQGDTLRIEVEHKTFIPTLLTPPMPGSVIDELRNKYSVFRTRHDPEYVEKKLEEDRQIEAKKMSIKEMDTPLKEINRKERKLRKAKGKGRLTRRMLHQIGGMIAKRRGVIMERGGMSVVGAPNSSESGDVGVEKTKEASTSTMEEPMPVSA